MWEIKPNNRMLGHSASILTEPLKNTNQINQFETLPIITL